MSKRINNIFKEKIKFENMLAAYKRAAKGKRNNKEVILFEMDLANNLTKILKQIYNGTYTIGDYRKFIIYEPKQREVYALPFADRVVHQWYVEEFIKPIFLPKMINDTYACIEKRGVHLAITTLRKYMKKMYKENPNYYILKCDISKFFYNIKKKILYKIIERKVKDRDFLEFTKKLLYQKSNSNSGIPIGNYTSQYFANIYLNELDHFIKEKLKVKYYVRYMDDFILLIENKEKSKEILKEITKFLDENLELELNKKTNYFKVNQGVNFCGFKIKLKEIRLLKRSKKKIYKRVKIWNQMYKNQQLDLKKTNASLRAWVGHASHITKRGLIQDVVNKCEWIYKETNGT